MHYNIDYSAIIDETAKRAKALEDIKSYLGAKAFNKIERDVKAARDANQLSHESFVFQLEMFAGVAGYPGQAWADSLNLVKKSPETRTDPAETPCNSPAGG